MSAMSPYRARFADIVDEPTRRRHRVVAIADEDARIVITTCAQRIANIGQPHPTTRGHLVAFPDCSCQRPITDCCA